MQRREHMLVSALGGYTLVVFFWFVLVGRTVDLTRLFSMIVSTFTWLALAQPDVCVRLDLFNQCWNLNIGQKGDFVFKNEPKHLTFHTYGNSNVTSSTSKLGTKFSYTQGDGATVIKFSNGNLVYLLDKETAWNFFAVPTTSNPNVSPSKQILALGPYLVRSASIQKDTVSLVGDNANTTTLE